MKDQDLDRLFKEKLAEAAYPYNPENWERMELLLDARHSGVAPWYWRYSAALLAVGVLLGSVIGFQPVPAGQPSKNPMAVPVTVQPASPARQESFDKPAPKSTNAPRKDRNSGAPLQAEPLAEKAASHSNDVPASSVAAQNTPAKTAGKIAAPSPAAEKEKSPGSSLSGRLAQNPATPRIAPGKAAALEIAGQNLLSVVPADLNPLHLNALPVLPLKSGKILDSTRGAATPAEIFIPGAPAFATHRFWLEGGLSLSSSFGNGHASGMLAGFHYEWQPCSGFSLTMGLNYRQTGNLNLAIRNDTTYFTNQGRQDISTVKRFAHFQTLSFPVNAYWHLNHKHALSGGLYLGLALRQKATLITTTQQPKSSPEILRDEVSGQHPEFTGTLSGLSLGYTYQVNKNWEAGLQFRYGLTDLTQDRVAPELREFHRLQQVQLVLRYLLF